MYKHPGKTHIINYFNNVIKMQKSKVKYCGGGKFRECQTPRHWALSL